jgi:hypothetical protein
VLGRGGDGVCGECREGVVLLLVVVLVFCFVGIYSGDAGVVCGGIVMWSNAKMTRVWAQHPPMPGPRSIKQSSINQINQPINQSTDQSNNHQLTKSINQSINQLINQSTNQSINQTRATNRWYGHAPPPPHTHTLRTISPVPRYRAESVTRLVAPRIRVMMAS